MSTVVVPPIADQQPSAAENEEKVTTLDTDQSPSPSEPDTDAIKMFVGQIPRQWNEVDCRRLFEAYGPVFSCNILRDKSTQSSKGCCFVTFFHRKDAIEAQCALHNVKVIDGMHHPVQMKPADTENRNDRKLFIGQLSKKHDEKQLREIFAKFGHIEDCSVLRDQDGKSRGCAFVTFTNRSCAVVATKEMHHSQTMEGCSAPLVVKFADTQKDKDVKTKAGLIGNGGKESPKGLLGNLSPALLQQLGGGQNIHAVASLLNLLGGPQAQQAQAQAQAQQPQQNVLGILGSVLSALGKLTEGDDVASATSSSATSSTSSTTKNHVTTKTSAGQLGQLDAITMAQLAQHNQLLALQGFAVQQAPQQNAHYRKPYSSGSPDSATSSATSPDDVINIPRHHHQPWAMVPPWAAVPRGFGLAGGLAGAKTTSPVAATLANHHQQQMALTPFGAGAAGAALDPYTAMQQQYALLANLQAQQQPVATAATQLVGNGDVKGPDGANLFIYHLPQDFGDTDLINTFAPFGVILSAKVFIDKVTNLSKCFGFVSFESPASATNAISAMNGFQIGSKRLKVQLKVDRGNPYNR